MKTELQNQEHRARDELQQAQRLLHSQATAMAELAHKEKKVANSNYFLYSLNESVFYMNSNVSHRFSFIKLPRLPFSHFVLQLLDFCTVIAQMLGVSMPASVPSCEVIKRLEVLIHSGHHFPLANQCVMPHHQHHISLIPDAPACSIITATTPGPEVPVQPLLPTTTTT